MATPPPPARCPPDATLEDALEVAADHWSGRPGAMVQGSRARRCIDLIGPRLALGAVTSKTGFRLILALEREGLSANSVYHYATTFRRVLKLALGAVPHGWPMPERPDRKRPPAVLSIEDYHRAAEWLAQRGWCDTADLVWLIAGTGLRYSVEVRPPGLLTWELGEDYDLLKVAGRYARNVPVVDSHARAVFRAADALEAIRARSHSGHLQRLRKALQGSGRGVLGGTFVAIRRAYARQVYERTGGNAEAVRELTGSSRGTLIC